MGGTERDRLARMIDEPFGLSAIIPKNRLVELRILDEAHLTRHCRSRIGMDQPRYSQSYGCRQRRGPVK